MQRGGPCGGREGSGGSREGDTGAAALGEERGPRCVATVRDSGAARRGGAAARAVGDVGLRCRGCPAGALGAGSAPECGASSVQVRAVSGAR